MGFLDILIITLFILAITILVSAGIYVSFNEVKDFIKRTKSN